MRESQTVKIVSIVCMTILGLGVLIVGGFTLSNDDLSKTFVLITGVLVSTIPSVFAALRADQAVRDMHNGVVKGKVLEALDERNVPTTGPLPVQKDDNHG